MPHHTWLVADGTTGTRRAFAGAEFHEAIGLTGLIVTKLDGSARGGMVAAVRAEVGPAHLLSGPRRKAGGPEALQCGANLWRTSLR